MICSRFKYLLSPSVAVIFLLQLLLSSILITADETTTTSSLEKTWTLYHSVNGGQDFTKRASVVLSIETTTDGGSNGAVDLSIANDNSTLNEETFHAVKVPSSMYQLKLVPDDGTTDFVLASVPGCQLLRANFREELVISLGPKASAISLMYSPLVSPLAPKSCEDPNLWNNRISNLPNQGWDTRISWETATPGMTLRPVMPNYRPPPGLKWLPRLGVNGKLYQAQGPPGTGDNGDGKGGKGGAGGQQPEMDATPMGFVRRYWYILLPLFLMNFMGVEPPPPEQQQGGGQQGGQQGGGAQGSGGGGAPGGGAAPSASPAQAPKQRRGKRG